MKNLLTAIVIFGMFMMPFAVYAQSEQQGTQAPPVAPALVREGDFAIKLVSGLRIGTAQNEADAETMLGSSGIAPKNGWIADYPVTPDIIGELQNAVSVAAGSQRLPMGKDEALKALQNLTGEFGLNVVADTSGKYSENQPPTSPQYTEPAVVNNYYYEEGPPVVTYYPPPWDYYYLYAWVPSPFWCSGFFFPGFFILHDFHRTVIFAHRAVVVTNHVFDHGTRRVVVIDPVRRIRGSGFRVERDVSHTGGFNSAEARKGAASISERSHERIRSANTMAPTTGRGVTGTHERSFSAPSMSNRGSVSSESSGRTSSAPSRSFSAPSMGSRGSSGEVHAGGGGHSFGHGGFSGGFGHGGCRGRC
jgi:hypothetical protein